MDLVKNVWLTDQEAGYFSLSFESKDPITPHHRLSIRENLFPKNPTQTHPLRHTVSISLLTLEDLILLRQKLDEFLQD